MKRIIVWISAVALFAGTLFAQNTVTYFDGKEDRTMTVNESSYAPKHPDVCSGKKKAEPAPAPKVEPVPAPIPETDSDEDGVFDSLDKCPGTPKGYKVDAAGCPKSVTLHINFAFNSSVIPESAGADVDGIVRFMNENPASSITIVGHTDIIGRDSYNQPLSEARAKALADKLAANGIDAGRISTDGKGSKEPIASNKTDEGRAQNRRIEILIH